MNHATGKGLCRVGVLACTLGGVALAQPAPDPVSPLPAPAETAPPPADGTTAAPAETVPEPVTPRVDPAPDAPADLDVVAPVVADPVVMRGVALHGFVSQGAFVSTDNDYIGQSSRGSLELFEVGLNASSQLTSQLRAGVQIFARDIGIYDEPPRIDWAFLDYRWKRQLGMRAGIIKMPLGLYNEYADIDAARLPILMPQGVYPTRNRDALLAHRGFSAYGETSLGVAGSVDYQAWVGTLGIPRSALTLTGASLERVDTKYVTGAQAFWHPPVEGLRVGATFLRASIDFNIVLDPASVTALAMAGLVPEDFNGRIVVSQRPTSNVIASAEYVRGPWLLAGEYHRGFKRQRSTIPTILPTFEEDAESFYGMIAFQATSKIQTGGYYSVLHLDVDDRRGHDPKYAENFHAFQRDLSATLRYDVNEHWLWKLEAHFIDGTADLSLADDPTPSRYWGMFLVRTTVTF